MLLFLHSISSLDDCIVKQCAHLHFMSLTFDLLHTELNLKIPLRTEISQIYIVNLPELCLGTPLPANSIINQILLGKKFWICACSN